MLLMLNNKYRQSGIGLLELMLSLAIIALLLIMATRYFTQAQRGQKVSNALSMIQGVRAAISLYTTRGYSVTAATIPELSTKGVLTKEIGGNAGDGKGMNPWGGDISLDCSAAATGCVLTLKSVEGPACNILWDTLKNQMTPGGNCAAVQTAPQDITFTFSG